MAFSSPAVELLVPQISGEFCGSAICFSTSYLTAQESPRQWPTRRQITTPPIMAPAAGDVQGKVANHVATNLRPPASEDGGPPPRWSGFEGRKNSRAGKCRTRLRWLWFSRLLW
jgi:hypothetical protein